VLFSPAFAKLQPRRTHHALPRLTSVFYPLAGNSFRCHRSENSPVSPAIATLPKAPSRKSFPCHTSETPGGHSQASTIPALLFFSPCQLCARRLPRPSRGVLCDLCVESFFLFRPSTVDCQPLLGSRPTFCGHGSRDSEYRSRIVPSRLLHLPLPTGVLESEWKHHDT
jgi:hypothetical protein